MISIAIVAGDYKEAAGFIRFHNLKRDTCLVVMGKRIFTGYSDVIKNCQLVLTENASKNTAYDLAVEELSRRMTPERGDCMIRHN